MTACVLEGLGTVLPPRRLTNDDYAKVLDTSDEWIRSRTGIHARYVADDDIATGDLATEAGARALKSAGGGAVDTVVVGTTTPDQLCPNTASIVAERLDLPHPAALDVNTACSSFVYGLATAVGMVTAGISDRLLLIGAETLVRFMNPQDRGTVVLFGDGAGAFVLRRGEPDELGAIGPFDLGSDGKLTDMLRIPVGGSRVPPHRAEEVPVEQRYFHMDGRETYRHAVRRMSESVLTVTARAGLGVGDLDRVVAHQANARIIEAVAKRLDVPLERFTLTVGEHANTSAASIPLALAADQPAPGERLALVAFGGGLTWGSTLMTWPELTPA